MFVREKEIQQPTQKIWIQEENFTTFTSFVFFDQPTNPFFTLPTLQQIDSYYQKFLKMAPRNYYVDTPRMVCRNGKYVREGLKDWLGSENSFTNERLGLFYPSQGTPDPDYPLRRSIPMGGYKTYRPNTTYWTDQMRLTPCLSLDEVRKVFLSMMCQTPHHWHFHTGCPDRLINYLEIEKHDISRLHLHVSVTSEGNIRALFHTRTELCKNHLYHFHVLIDSQTTFELEQMAFWAGIFKEEKDFQIDFYVVPKIRDFIKGTILAASDLPVHFKVNYL